MAYSKEMYQQLDRLNNEVSELRKRLIQESPYNKAKSETIWQELMQVSDQISNAWQGVSAVEEIASQRAK